MKPVLIQYLKCISCDSSELRVKNEESKEIILTDEEIKTIKNMGKDIDGYFKDITKGILECQKCGQKYPVVNSIPRMYTGAEKDFGIDEVSTDKIRNDKDVKHVQKSFSKEWDELNYDDGLIWLWTKDSRITTFCEELRINSVDDIKGKLMLDAGCGSAIMSMNLTEKYNIETVGLDMAFVIDRAQHQKKSNLFHLVHGSVLNPPLRNTIFDIVYSHGVLHHTYNTKKAFNAVEKLVKNKGTLYVWLYGKKKGWNRFRFLFIRTARFFISRMPDSFQKIGVYIMYLIHTFVRFIKRVLGLEKVQYKTKQQLLVSIRDKYTPKYAREHTENEVKGWFKEKGYENVSRRTEWPNTYWWNGSTDLSIIGYKSGDGVTE
jgi:ubiquinone/menaquinone biosynthesis C-methylase UbiE/uncharacterized protein YbaR (Trm112 family)